MADLHELNAQLVEVKTLVQQHAERSTERYAALNQRLEGLDSTLNGNGKPGLKTRIDRLEQRGRIVTWFTGTSFASVISFVIAWIGTHFKGGS